MPCLVPAWGPSNDDYIGARTSSYATITSATCSQPITTSITDETTFPAYSAAPPSSK